MAEDNDDLQNGTIADGQSSDVSTLDALHLDGKGTERLDDAEENELPQSTGTEKEDVKGFANVQSADRNTFEDMQDGAPAEEGAAPTGGQVIPDVYTPSEPDNTVAAQFENPFPNFAPEAADDDTGETPPARNFAPAPQETPVQDQIEGGLPAADGEDGADPVFVAPEAETFVPEPPPETEDPEDPILTVAQAPTVTVADASGVEDQLTKLNIGAAVNDSDGGGDRLSSLTISGIPDGFIITDADGNPLGTVINGTWTLTDVTPATLDNIYLKNLDSDDDADFSGDFTLSVTVTASEEGSTATTTLALPVHIEAVADLPVLAADDSAGMENTWISLDIEVGGKDTDGSEHQTVYISGAPDGALLNHGTYYAEATTLADGTTVPANTWVVDAGDLGDLAIKPPTDNSTDFILTVWADSTEGMNGDTATTAPQTILVDVGVVDPSVTGSGVGNEDGFADLTLTATINAKAGSEVLTVYVENLPDGVVLRNSTGTELATTTYTDADGVSHTGYDVTAYWHAADGSITGLQVGWDTSDPATTHLDTDFTLDVRAVVRDGDSDTDTAAVQSAAPDISDVVTTIPVTIKAVADAPTVTASAIGVEDKWFSLDIDAALVDQDGSETLTVYVSGLPAGAQLNHGTVTTTDITLDDGKVIPAGSWLVSAEDLDDLRIKAPQDSDGDLSLTITAVATEDATGAQVAAKTAGTQTTIAVQVLSDADTPTVSVVDAAQHVDEDAFYNLRTALAGGGYAVGGSLSEHDGADGQTTSADTSETLTFTITAQQDSRISINGVISELHAGETVTVSAADVFAGNVLVGGVADWASGGGNGTLKFDITTISTEANDATDDGLEDQLQDGLSRSGTAESTIDTLTLVVDPVHDTATITAANAGFEDGLSGLNDNGGDGSGTPIALTPTITFTDTDGSEKPDGSVSITSDDPAMTGGTLYLNGVEVVPTINADGSYTWTITGATFTETAGNQWTMQGLSFLPPADLAGTAHYDITIGAYDSDTSVSRDVILDNATIAITAVADLPEVAVQPVLTMETASAAGNVVALDIGLTQHDDDGSETQYVYISGIPLAAGTLDHVAATYTTTFTADGQTITASASNPVYKILASDLDDLHLTIKQGYSEDLAIQVYAVSEESGNHDIAVSAPQTLRVDIGVLDPVITGSHAAGTEATYIALTNVTVNAAADDATDTLTVYVDDLTPGFALYSQSGGTYTALTATTYTDSDGVVHTRIEIPASLIGADGALSGVYVRSTTAYSDADASFTIRAVVTDADADASLDAGGIDMNTALGQPYADTAVAEQQVTVQVDAVAQAPVVIAANSIIVEDRWASLDIDAHLVDTDSETLSDVTITGPAGFTLGTGFADGVTGTTYTGVDNGDGTITYTLTQAQLTGLQIRAADESDTDFNLTISVTSTEHGTDGGTVAAAEETTSKTITVQVLSDADKPTVSVIDGTQVIEEDSWFNLQGNVSGAVGESPNDASESITDYRITATQDSRVSVNGVVTTLHAGQSVTVSAADIAAGKVLVGGVANWASNDPDSTLKFNITSIATETRGAGDDQTETSSGTDYDRSTTAESDPDVLVLTVTPVADSTNIGAVAKGVEDPDAGYIAFNPVITLQDPDSEVLTGTVGILIAQGTEGHLALLGSDGSLTTLTSSETVTKDGVTYDVYRVDVDDLSHTAGSSTYTVRNIVYVPDEDSDKDVKFRIETETVDPGSANPSYPTISSVGTLVIQARADAPIISHDGADQANAATITVGGDENRTGAPTHVALDLSALPKDGDGSETLSSASLENVPEGWTVGYLQADGSVSAIAPANGVYALDPARLDQVVLVPPANDATDATGIILRVVSTEHLTNTTSDNQVAVKTAESTLVIDVDINAMANMPTLTVSNVRVEEDHMVKLDVRAALTDTDGSETLRVEITGAGDAAFVHADGTAYDSSHYSGGVWTFSADDLNDLYFKPAANSNDDATLTVKAIATDSDDTTGAATGDDEAVNTATIQVVVTGVADSPVYSDGAHAGEALPATGAVLTATGTEDGLIDLNLDSYHSGDTDGSESFSAVLTGIPDGVTIVMGTTADGEDTSKYLKYIGVDANGDAMWSVAPGYLQYVSLKAPANYSGTFDIGVRLISTENDGDSTSVDATMQVVVLPDADSAGGSIGATAGEDQYPGTGIPFSLSANAGDLGGNGGNAALGNGGIERVTDIDSVSVDVTALIAAGNTPYVMYNGVRYDTVTTDGVHQFIVIGDTALTVTAGAAAGLSGFELFGVPDGWSQDVPVSMVVETTDGGDTATTTVSGSIVITAQADEPDLALTASGTGTVTLTGDIALNDGDGSEYLYVVVGGVPNGVTVQAVDGDGHAVKAINNGDGSWTLPAGTDYDSITLTASHGAGTSVAITVSAVAVDTDPDSHAVTTAGKQIGLTVNLGVDSGGTDPGTLEIPTATVTGSLTTTEDGAVSLSGLSFSIEDADGNPLTYDHGTGTVSDGSALSVVVVIPTGWTLSGTAYLIDSTGGVNTYTIPYSALGSTTLTPPADYAGTAADAVQMRAVVTTQDGWYDETSADLTAIPVTVTPVADGAAITTTITSVAEDDGTASLTLTLKDQDDDHSESLTDGTVTIRVYAQEDSQGHVGIPGTLSGAGTGTVVTDGNGVPLYTEYTVHLSDTSAFTSSGGITIGGLTFDPAGNFSGAVTVTVRVGVTDSVDGMTDTTVSESSASIVVTPVIDTPVIAANDVTGSEDATAGIALNITLDNDDLTASGSVWSSETQSVVITGVPAGATLIGAYNNGTNADGTTNWTVKDSAITYDAASGKFVLSGVKYVPGQDDSSDYTLKIVTYTKEAGGTVYQASAPVAFTVLVGAITDGATIDPQDASGVETLPVELNLGLQALDASEGVSLTLTGIPEGGSIVYQAADGVFHTIGTDGGDGSWTLSEAEVASLNLTTGGSLYFSGPANVAGTWTLTATATAIDHDSTSDGANQSAGTAVDSNTLSFTVTTTAHAEAPILTVAASGGDEGTAIALNLSAVQTTDTDGSEALSLTITGAPEGTVFITSSGQVISAVTEYDAGGNVTNRYWVIESEDGSPLSIAGLSMRAPADYNGAVTLTVIAQSAEADQTAASAPLTLVVNVAAVNDAPDLDISAGVGVGAGNHLNPITLLASGADIAITDVDSATLSSMTMTIGNAQDGDTLGLTGLDLKLDEDGHLVATLADGTSFEVSYANGTLTFSGTATLAQYETLAQAVIFTSTTDTLVNGSRDVVVTIYDDQGASGSDDIAVTVTGAPTLAGGAHGDAYFDDDGSVHLVTNEAPVVTAAGTDADGTGAIHALNGVAISDNDGSNLSGMVVTLTGGQDGDTLALSGQDVALDGNGNLVIAGTDISVSYDSVSHALIFSGSASHDTYSAIAGSIVLSSNSGTLDEGSRTVSVMVTDEQGQVSDTLSATTTLDDDVTLTGDALGDVRWGADGSASVDDTIIVQFGDAVSHIDGGLGTDTLMMQFNGGDGDWTFDIDADGIIHATSASDDDKSFIVQLDNNVGATLTENHDGVIFNGDASGKITFDDHTIVQFDNIDRLVG